MSEQQMVASFLPGAGVGIAAVQTFAVLEPMNSSLAERLWNTLGEDGTIDDILEILSSSGLRTLGSFALAQLDGAALRVVVRGTGRAAIATESGLQVITATGVRTWVEEIVGGRDDFELSIGEPTSEPLVHQGFGALPFRVASGLVPATLLRFTSDARVDLSNAPFDERAVSTAIIANAEDELVAPPVLSPAPAADAGGETDDGRTRYPTDESLVEHRAAAAGSLPPAVPTSSQPGARDEPDDYDAIYGRTVARSVQAAAVRTATDDADEPTDASPPPAPTASLPPPQIDHSMPAAPTPLAAPSGGGLISAIPGGPSGGVPSSGSEVPPLGDHDGRTMTAAQLAALRAGRSAGAPAPAPAASTGGMMVQAMVCAEGHANPPQVAYCTRCGLRIDGAPTVVARPSLGVLRFSNSATFVLDRPALIGRNPKVEGVVAGEVPAIVKLDVGQGLSRTHAAVRLEGWTVLLDDLNSANGTVVRLPGREPRRLHPGEPVLLEPGAEVDFGGEISCRMDAD